MDGLKEEWMDGRKDDWLVIWMKELMDGWMDRRIAEWWMEVGWKDGLIN